MHFNRNAFKKKGPGSRLGGLLKNSDCSQANADRNAEDRKFLHEFASPLAVLKYSLRKIQSGVSDLEGDEKLQAELVFARAADAIQKLERLHADFKVTVYEREIEDGQEPLEGISDRLKTGTF